MFAIYSYEAVAELWPETTTRMTTLLRSAPSGDCESPESCYAVTMATMAGSFPLVSPAWSARGTYRRHCGQSVVRQREAAPTAYVVSEYSRKVGLLLLNVLNELLH